ncbi:hypothetical protein ES705_18281 [subsurface metagenome]
MPKYQCERCGALYAGWAGGGICSQCGGKLKLISWAKYYEESKKQDKIQKYVGQAGHD